MLSWPSILENFIISLVAGIIVSFTFILLLLRFFKPKFEISPFICHTNDGFRFKIVNKSIYHAFDTKIELFEMKPYPHSAGKMNIYITPISIQTRNITTIPRYHKKPSSKDPYNLYAVLFLTDEDLNTIFEKHGVYVEMRLTVRHGLTGLAATFVKQFDKIDVIKARHKFCQGYLLDTIPENQMT